jgi:hypothetical protein
MNIYTILFMREAQQTPGYRRHSEQGIFSAINRKQALGHNSPTYRKSARSAKIRELSACFRLIMLCPTRPILRRNSMEGLLPVTVLRRRPYPCSGYPEVKRQRRYKIRRIVLRISACIEKLNYREIVVLRAYKMGDPIRIHTE